MPAPSNTTGTLTDVVKTIFDQQAGFAYRAANVHRLAVTWKRSTDAEPQKGLTIAFTIVGRLTPATSALTENTDPSPVALADTQPTVTLTEYGNVTQSTKKLRLASLIDLDMAAVKEITMNMEESMDLVARAAAIGGSNVLRPNGHAKNAIVATDTLNAALVRQIKANLKGLNAPPPSVLGNGNFLSIIHPYVVFDLQAETGQNAWSGAHVLGGDVSAIYSGMVNDFLGFSFIENANANNDVDAGSGGTVDVYHTLFIGEQFLGEGVGESQHVVVGPVVDQLERFQPVGWYALEGFGRIRENSAYRIECASSIGAN